MDTARTSALAIRLSMSHVAGDALEGPLRRPPVEAAQQDLEYLERFDFFTRFYDVFEAHDGTCVYAVGPPEAAGIRVSTWPGREPCETREMFLLEPGVPPDPESTGGRPAKPLRRWYSLTAIVPPRPGSCPALLLESDGREEVVAVQPNLAPYFAGRRVLVTKNRDMDLIWIRDWAEYHAQEHGFDAVILYDTGSTRYQPAEIERVLTHTPGLSRVAVIEERSPFGPVGIPWRDSDSAARYLQQAIIAHALRRMAPLADLLLSIDIDELLLVDDPDHFARLLRDPAHPALVLQRENVFMRSPRPPLGPRHRDCSGVLPTRPRDVPKWIIRPCAAPDTAVPHIHGLLGCPLAGCPAETALLLNLQPLSTGWKTLHRTQGGFAPNATEVPSLRLALDRVPWAEPDAIGAWDPLAQDDPALLVRWGAERLAAGDAPAALLAADLAQARSPGLRAVGELRTSASHIVSPDPGLPAAPGLTAGETVLLDAAAAGVSCVVQFGPNGIAPRLVAANIPRIVVVEAAAGALARLRQQSAIAAAMDAGRLELLRPDIGKTGRRGAPRGQEARERWPDYWRAPWTPDIRAAADLVIVGGPFRIACALEALLSGVDGLAVLVLDCGSGEVLAVLRPHAERIGEAGRSALFTRAPRFDPAAARRDLEAHAFDPR